MQQPVRKIAIISISLGLGGAERFAGQLSCILSDLGYEVHNIIINDAVDYPYCGMLFNLGKQAFSGIPFMKKISKGKHIRRYLSENVIDTIIDNRTRDLAIREIFSKWMYAGRRQFYIVHSHHLPYYFPASGALARWLYADAQKMICVSRKIEARVKDRYGLSNTVTIHNHAEISEMNGAVDIDHEFILFFGRLDDRVKNFRLMLDSFKASALPEKGVKLVIMGDGGDGEMIENISTELNLSDAVILKPFTRYPGRWIKSAKFTILTSRHEGFPMALIESLAFGTPVVSVDCESGPSEIVQHEVNGLLVENHNVTVLAGAMERMFTDILLFENCRNNAVSSIGHLSRENIMRQWEEILKD